MQRAREGMVHRAMRQEHDAVVVGAGPAGSSCAASLALGGARCILVDWQKHPLGKPCGGAVSPRAACVLEQVGLMPLHVLDGSSLAVHRTMSCYWRGRHLRTYESRGDPVRIVERSAFDRLLLDRALESGAVPVQGDPVTGITPGRPCVVEMRSGRRIESPVVIGADGAGSIVRRSCRGLRGRPLGFGIECFVEAPSVMPQGLQIHFGLVPWGYGWVFPRGDDVCIGMGAIGRRVSPPRLKASLDMLLEQTGLAAAEPPALRAAAIPGFGVELAPVPGRVYLCGDAAGLTDRLTGEGIGHAVESGALVARAILGGWDRNRLVREAGSGSAGLVRQSMAARLLVYHPVLQREAMRRLEARDKFFAGYWDLISGAVDYRGLLLGFLRSSRWPPAWP